MKCWEIIVRCCRLPSMQLRLVVPWQVGVGHSIGLQRKCGSAVRCMRSSSVTLALHGGLPWVRWASSDGESASCVKAERGEGRRVEVGTCE
jgi:hypothetical protein